MEFDDTFDRSDSAVCPLCGGEAEWGLLEDDIVSVEVICTNCGRFEAPKARFDEAQTEPRNPEEKSS